MADALAATAAAIVFGMAAGLAFASLRHDLARAWFLWRNRDRL